MLRILGARLNELETKVRSMEEQSRSPNMLTPLGGNINTLRAQLENTEYEDDDSSAFETDESRYADGTSQTEVFITQERDVQTDEDSSVSHCPAQLIERSMCTEETEFVDSATDASVGPIPL